MPHPESKMRASVLAALRKNGFHAEAVDNESCSPGTPDINYAGVFRWLAPKAVRIEGWTELKQLSAWPKRADTIVKIGHFTEKQRSWLRRRWDAGGVTSLLLRVGPTRSADWLLFDGEWAAEYIGKTTRDQMIEAASGLNNGPFSASWLAARLVEVHEFRHGT